MEFLSSVASSSGPILDFRVGVCYERRDMEVSNSFVMRHIFRHVSYNIGNSRLIEDKNQFR